MIKTITYVKDKICCDICGEETGYDADQGYAKNKKHFCHEHSVAERTFEQLIAQGCEKSAEVYFNEVKEMSRGLEV